MSVEIKNNILSFEHTTIVKRDDGIVEVRCAEDMQYEISHFNEMHEATGELCSYKKHPVLFLVGKYTAVSKEAREFGATQEALEYSKAEAYVIHSIAQKLIANFYLKVNKPKVPTKFFSEKDKAEEWLSSFL